MMCHELFYKACTEKTSKICLNSWQTALFVYAKIVIMRPEILLFTSQGGNLRNASELCRKQLHFWMQKSWKCAQNFLRKPHQVKMSKMCLNLTANSFIYGHINRKIMPRTFL